MSRTEFAPETLRLLGRLAWMKDADEDHWFSVPSSNDQLIFSEEGTYAHSLTGVRFEIFEITDFHGRPSVQRWIGTHPQEANPPRFSELVEAGEDLYSALMAGQLEIWSSDPDAIFQWARSRVVFADENWEFSVILRSELARRLKLAELEFDANERANRIDWDARRAPEREHRDALRACREQWRSQQEYDLVFAEVYGKTQGALGEQDPKNIISCAHQVVEYRMRLGRWSQGDIEHSVQQHLPDAVSHWS